MLCVLPRLDYPVDGDVYRPRFVTTYALRWCQVGYAITIVFASITDVRRVARWADSRGN